MKKLLTAVAAGAALFASLPALADQASADQALKEAQAAVAQADSIHYLWTTTEKLMKDAQDAYKKNEFDTAEQLAKEAKIQAERAYQQGQTETKRVQAKR
ncbi:MAG: hypothetical protein ACOY5C_08605 [Pseudomonadota bacterium]